MKQVPGQGGKWREEVGLLGLLQWAWVGPTEPAEDLLRVKKVGTWELTALGSLQVRAPLLSLVLTGKNRVQFSPEWT